MNTVAMSRGGDQLPRRIGAERAHRVDLFRDLHRNRVRRPCRRRFRPEIMSPVRTGPEFLNHGTARRDCRSC